MSSCLSGGARTYSLDLDIVKSPSTSSTRSSHSSSPSSTLSESSNSPLAISTRKPRTPRKRPNQTYTEAAALLSTIYPNIFSAKNLRKLCKHTKSCNDSFDESPDLLPPFPALDNAAFLLYQPVVVPEKTLSRIEPKLAVDYFEKSPCEQSRSPSEHDLVLSPPSQLSGGYDEDYDFDAESILDEEVEGGIDSIMGSLSVASDSSANESFGSSKEALVHGYYGSLMGLGLGGRFDFGFGMKTVVALRRATDDGDWWRVPTVEVQNIVKPKDKSTPEKNKKKKKLDGGREEKVAKGRETTTTATMASPSPSGSEGQKVGRLCLKLSYDKVLDAWSDGSPYSNDFSPESSEAIAKLAQIDLSPEWRQGEENGGLREASVLRYREKRRTRLFSKKIRYKVRKVNADRRPRIQGRFVRRP